MYRYKIFIIFLMAMTATKNHIYAQPAPTLRIDTSAQILSLFNNDNYMVAAQTGFMTIQNPPTKLGAVISPTQPWEQKELIMPVVAQNTGIDGSKYTLFVRATWYDTIYPKIQNWSDFVCAYNSDNGVDFVRPNLGLIAFGQSNNNNLMYHRGYNTPYYMPNAPPNQRWQRLRRYYAPNEGNYGGGAIGVEYAATPTGIYTPFHSTISLHRTLDTHNQVYYDKKANEYIIYARAWQHNGSYNRISIQVSNTNKYQAYGRAVVRIALTPQQYFGDWAVPNGWDLFGNNHLVIDADDSSAFHKTVLNPINNHTDNYNPGFVAYTEANDNDSVPQAFFMFSSMFDASQAQFSGIYMATSRNNKDWHYINTTQPYIARSTQPNGGDAGNVFMGIGYIRQGNDILQYYSGTNTHTQNHSLTNSQIFATKQRLHGFTALQANTNAYLTTQNITTTAEYLTINSQPNSINSEIRIQIADENNTPIPGFTFDDAIAITTDSINTQVRWKNTQTIQALQGRTIKLNIKAKHANIYSFQCQNKGTILPFSFENISAQKINNQHDIAIHWQTRWEQPIKKYYVERQINNNNYTTIAQKRANDLSFNDFIWIDSNLKGDAQFNTTEQTNVVQYRIRIEYINGKIEYSDTATVLNLNATNTDANIQIYPNITDNQLIVNVLDTNNAANLSFFMIDMQGRRIRTTPIQPNTPNYISLQNIGKSMYIVGISNGESKALIYKKIVIQ